MYPAGVETIDGEFTWVVSHAVSAEAGGGEEQRGSSLV